MRNYKPASKTFNTTYRVNELRKINDQNQSLIKRLQAAKPVYESQKWENDRKKSKLLCEKLSQNASIYLPSLK